MGEAGWGEGEEAGWGWGEGACSGCMSVDSSSNSSNSNIRQKRQPKWCQPAGETYSNMQVSCLVADGTHALPASR